MRVLMLAPYMKMGYGVSEAIAALSRHMEPIGIMTTVGCLEYDRHFYDIDVRTVRPDPQAVLDLAAKLGASAVVAHGSPFFEVLPSLSGKVRTIAYEYGDPTPEMFGDDADERRRIADAKKINVYPKVDVVAAISEFIRHDIEWPQAQVVRLGVEHVPDLGPKPLVPPLDSAAPLRVGTLMRLGVGESRYKGSDHLLQVKDLVGKAQCPIQFEVMGRGDPGDADRFETAGFRVHLNASEDERIEFLRGVDVFVSPSQWEGTNLPLVEAAALGTPSLAFDTGSHPEFTPLLFRSVTQLADQILAYEIDRVGLLRDHGELCYRYVRRAMAWDDAALQLGALIRDVDARPPHRRPLRVRARTLTRRVRNGVVQNGMKGTGRQVWDKARNKLGSRRG